MTNEPPKPARRTFDETFKRDAVALLLKGDKRVKQLAQDLGVSQWNLRDWREQYGPSAPVKSTEQLEAELRLQALHLRADSRLRQADLLTGCSESAFPRHGDEGLELADHSQISVMV